MEKKEPVNTDGVNLLVALLLSYAEIGKVCYEPDEDALHLTYIVNAPVDTAEFKSFNALLKRNLAAYYSLEELPELICRLERTACGAVTFITLIRDISTLFKSELSLVSELMKESFGERLGEKENAISPEDEATVQEDFIDNMLNNIRVNKIAVKLIGVREDGRVMIFHK